MQKFAVIGDKHATEAEMPWSGRGQPKAIYPFLSRARDSFAGRAAVSFQLTSGPADKATTLSWGQLHEQVTRAANLFRSLGIGPEDAVAYVLPNSLETVVTLLGGMVAGIANPVNPMLDPEHMAGILRETKAKVVVTLRAFPKTDVPQRVAQAVALAPDVTHVIEVDLAAHLPLTKRLLVGFARPKNPVAHKAKVLGFAKALRGQPSVLTFEAPDEDRVSAYFHTGGTTGLPKVAQHRSGGMIYNGWIGHELLFRETDVVLCPLPMFHVLACYPVLMSMIASGAHVVFPTPAGYRGEGVFDNFWKLIARYKATYVITVPTALSALMQRKVDADISSLRGAFSGSAPLAPELYNRFKAATGVQVIEGYGLTEATCLVACNPPDGEKKIGSVGLPFPYTDVRILHLDGAGAVLRECGVDEVGEICVANPGIAPGAVYTETAKNAALFVETRFMRTGDLGRIDPDGYLFITGRAKDLIIRGGHNIDPAGIEEALMAHPDVAMVGAIGQPDAHAGEVPCAYVELVKGAGVTVAELAEYAASHIAEQAAIPKYIEIVDEMPKTAVGKVFKPELRKRAITRVFDKALAQAGHEVRVSTVIEDRKRGLVAQLLPAKGSGDDQMRDVLGAFPVPWEWAGPFEQEAHGVR
jgi:fatty-acyl-CoA synthase